MRRLWTALLAVISVVVISDRVNAQEDPWWGEDKALHYSFSAVIAGGGYAAAVPFTDERLHRALVGGGLSLAAGAAKEGYDATGAGNASYRDFTWDVVGAATGVGLALLIDWVLSAKNEAPRRPSPAADGSREAAQYAARRWLSAE